MKYEDFKPVQEAINRLKEIKTFEKQQEREPGGSLTIIPCNGDNHSRLIIPGHQQQSQLDTPIDDALATRLNIGNYAIQQGIARGLVTAKKELCTFLHDAGVDITALKKELKL